FLILPPPPRSTLFPYTTLFRSSWFVFVIRLNDLFEFGDRDDAIRELRSEGIGCSNYFPPIHLQPYMVELLGHKSGDFPVCEHVADRKSTRLNSSHVEISYAVFC